MATNPQNQQGTGFTNLQQLMQANQGNRLGQAVGSGIQQAGQQVQSGLQKSQQDFNTQSQAGQLGTQAQRENVQNVLQDPTQVSDQNVADFAKYRSGQYSGPQDLSNISTLKGQAQQAQNLGQQVGTSGGRQALLQQYAAGPGQYNSGQQRLDNLLLGAQGGNQLKQARQSVSGLNQQVGGAEQAAQQQAQQYQNQAQGFGQQVTGQVQNAQGAIYNPAQQQAQQANVAEAQGLSKEQAAQQLAQSQNQLSADALQKLGLTAGQDIYGVNLGKYLGYTPQNQQATAINMMQQPQVQQYQGLQKLMGQTPVAAPQTPYQAGQATFNQAGLATDIAANKAQVDPFENYYAQIANAQRFGPGGQLYAGIGGNPYSSGGTPGMARAWSPDQQAALAALGNIRNQYGGTVSVAPDGSQS